MAVSFGHEIRRLFRDSPDVDSMKNTGSISRPTMMSEPRQMPSMPVWKTVVCPVMALGPRSKWRCSNNGWRKAWHPNPSMSRRVGEAKTIKGNPERFSK
jgi:hypothetical protein